MPLPSSNATKGVSLLVIKRDHSSETAAWQILTVIHVEGLVGKIRANSASQWIIQGQIKGSEFARTTPLKGTTLQNLDLTLNSR